MLMTLVLPICVAQGSCLRNSTADPTDRHQAELVSSDSLNTDSLKTGSLNTGSLNTGSLNTGSLNTGLRAHLEHYWDGVETDTLSAEVLEQRLVDYIYLGINADKELRQQCWQTIAKIFPDQQPNHLVADYLGDQESPLYAPEMLEEYLATIAEMFEPESVHRIRVDYLLGEIRKNKPGQKIADIELVAVVDSEHTTLHKLIAQGETDCKVLFYDPECEECAALISRLAADPTAGRIIAVSVMETAKSLPAYWHSCMAADSEQLDERFYLPRLPQIYIVSPDLIIRQ